MTHDQYVEILKDTLKKQALKSAIKYIVSKVAFLGWGPLGPLLKFLVGKMLTVFIDHTEIAVYLLYTDFRVARQGKDYNEALIANSEAQKNGTPEQKAQAEQNLKDSFIRFVKLTN